VSLLGVVSLVTVLLLGGCSGRNATTPPEFAGPKASSPVQAGMRLDMQTDQEAYFAGHPIKVRVSLVNTTNKEINFTTPTSLVFDVLYEIRDDPSVKRWSDGQQFAQVITPHTLQAGAAMSQTLEFTIVRGGPAGLWARLDTGTSVLDTAKVTITIQ
jgi:hypothetical protein